MKSNFRYSLENFRGIAIIFVMLCHIESLKTVPNFGNYFHYFLVDGTAWFVFISGYLFYYLECDKFNYAKYLTRKFKFVVLPYFIISSFAIAAGIYFYQYIIFDLTPIEYALWLLVSGGIVIAPMWFIPMIVIFFLLTPAFKALAATRYIIPATIAALIFSVFSFRPIFNANAVFSFLHFGGFYLLGIAGAKHAADLELLSKNLKLMIILGAAIIFFLVGAAYPGMMREPLQFIGAVGQLNYIILGKLALLVIIFLAFELYFNKPNRTLAIFAKISFGLFFIHGFMTILFSRYLHSLFYAYPGSEPLAEIGFVVLGSIAIVMAIKNILGQWSRYVIGC